MTEPGACARCTDLKESGPYPIDKAPALVIDSHPNCRCAKVPATVLSADDSESSSTGKVQPTVLDEVQGVAKSKYIGQARNESSIIGVVTSDGIVIAGLTAHLLERAAERKVTLESMLDALEQPIEITPTKYDENQRASKQYRGAISTVSLNPESGYIVTAFPTRKNIRKRHGL